jgi:flagellin
MLNRLVELAQQSASGTYSSEQRSALNSEFGALTEEIQRISDVTHFDGRKLLSGGDSVAFQVGFDGSELSWLAMTNIQATLAELGLAEAGETKTSYSLVAESDATSIEASRSAVYAVKAAIIQLNRSRGSLGAMQSRLQATVDNLAVARESFQSTESGIIDADFAEESAELAKVSVRQQAGSALLAQANLQPRLVLELLRD